MTDRSKATTHAEVCWSWGPAHYECAMREIERLRKMHQDAYQRGLQAGSRGLREIYDAIQEVKRQDAWDNTRLTEALMEAEERAERAEAENKRLREELSKMRAEPSDEEIDAIAASMPDGAGGMLKQWGYRQFARALLARYGAQPAASAEPVAQIYRKGFQHGSIVWTASGLAADLPDGTELYAAIDAAQAPFIEHETLRRALSNLGIAAPVSNEELGFDMGRYIRRVVHAAAQAPQDERECERCGLTPTQHTIGHWCDNQSYRTAQAPAVPPEWISDQVGGDFDDLTGGQGYRRGWNDCRAAMLKAAPATAPAVPEGWKLVPVEPTREQWEAFDEWSPPRGQDYAGGQSVSSQNWWAFRHRYAAMLAAAPTPPTSAAPATAGDALDAARYRWLRDRMVAGDLADETRAKLALRVLGPIAKRPADPDCCGELDAAIDAMLKTQEGEQ